jgi:hypothetical protein
VNSSIRAMSPSAIRWRQLVPQAASNVSGAAVRIFGSTPNSPIHKAQS